MFILLGVLNDNSTYPPTEKMGKIAEEEVKSPVARKGSVRKSCCAVGPPRDITEYLAERTRVSVWSRDELKRNQQH